jgi:hypothetical protein
MMTPKITKMVINGILRSLPLSKNKIIKEIIVKLNVIMLNLRNVIFRISSGLVSVL